MSTPLENSRRVVSKLTYAPLILPDADQGAALQVAAAMDELSLLPGEAASLVQQPSMPPGVVRVLPLFEEFASATGSDARLRAASALARQSTSVLTEAVLAVGKARDQALAAALPAISEMTRAYLETIPGQTREPATGQILGRLTLLESRIAALSPASSPSTELIEAGGSNLVTAGEITRAASTFPALPEGVANKLAPQVASQAMAAAAWAQAERPQLLNRLTDAIARFVPVTMTREGTALLQQGLPFLAEQALKAPLAAGHLTQRNLQPIGLLHLERLVMTPLDVERGELIYTLPLAPNEKVTLAHKEWTLREEEYSRFVQDYMQNYSERGVAEKGDMAIAARSETEHSKTLSMSKALVPGAATVGQPVETTTSTDVTSDKQSQEQSRAESREITERASALAVRDQKVSFTVTTVSGSQDFTAQLFENTHKDQVMLIDYYRRMRKWKNQLYRTGIRLTYDVVLPDPGKRLRDRWQEVASIDAELAQSFAMQIAPPSLQSYSPMTYQNFASAASGVAGTGTVQYIAASNPFETDVNYFRDLAATYGAALPQAPEYDKVVEITHQLKEPAGPIPAVFTLTLPVPDTHEVSRLWVGGRLVPDGAYALRGEFRSERVDFASDNAAFQSKELKLLTNSPANPVVAFIATGGPVGVLRVWAEIKPRKTAWMQWLLSAGSVIRQAAMGRFNERREILRQRRAALLKELQAPDTLSLRRMEREQIMHLVLEWLFPEFKTSGKAYADALAQKPGSWQPAMEYGEYIKFVHRAIDWDNALVLLYPYFWDAPAHQASKVYFDHADGAHKEFLRAGAARVILAIMPGAEGEIVALLDAGEMGDVTASPRFRPVIDAVERAHDHFADISNSRFDAAPDDGEAEIPGFAGDLIGEWNDWTPTSALDMETTLRPVTQET